MNCRYYYHVTPEVNAARIFFTGLDPRVKFPARESTRSWFVGESHLAWGIAHVSARHKVSVDKLAVFRFDPEDWLPVKLKRHGNPSGLYYTDETGIFKHNLHATAEYCLIVIGREDCVGLDKIWEKPF